MILVKKPYESALEIIGTEKMEQDCRYRFSAYTVLLDADDATLLYNGMTGEMIRLARDEEQDEYLIARRFMVRSDYDEHALVAKLKKHYFSAQSDDCRLNFCTILTTTCCNARCFYCYERNLKKQTMDARQALGIAKYLADNADKNGIVLDWYGGEPLLNNQVIDVICNELKRRNINYSSMMISNGYLFDSEILRCAKNLWKLTRVQITLDGLNDVYSDIKKYTNGDHNAFDRVMFNICSLMENGIHAEIRINIDLYNLDNAVRLTEYLINRFCNQKYINVYLHPLFQNHSSGKIIHTQEEWLLIAKKAAELENRLYRHGLFECGLRQAPKTHACLADNPKACTIMPDGNIIRCRDYPDAAPAGNAIDNTVFGETVRNWRELSEELEQCGKCVMYPECSRLKMCDEHKECNSADVLFKENNLKLSMLETFREFKKKQGMEK